MVWCIVQKSTTGGGAGEVLRVKNSLCEVPVMTENC